MDNLSLSDQDVAERARAADGGLPRRPRRRWRALAVFAVLAIVAAVGGQQVWRGHQ
jgi:hypothetical protein